MKFITFSKMTDVTGLRTYRLRSILNEHFEKGEDKDYYITGEGLNNKITMINKKCIPALMKYRKRKKKGGG